MRNYLDDPLNSPNSMLKHNDLRVIRMQVLKLKTNILIVSIMFTRQLNSRDPPDPFLS